MATTARTLVKQALQDLGVLGAADSLDDNDAAFGLDALNQWLSRMRLKRTMVLENRREVFALAAGTASATIGPGGTFNTLRPAYIDRKAIIIDNTATDPVESHRGPLLTLEEWQSLSVRSQTAESPVHVFYDKSNAAGLGTLFFWPVPTLATVSVVLWMPRPLQNFADLDTSYDLADGYEFAIRKNLACTIADAFDAPPTQQLKQDAAEGLADIQRGNVRVRTLRMPAGLQTGPSRYNIYTDDSQ